MEDYISVCKCRVLILNSIVQSDLMITKLKHRKYWILFGVLNNKTNLFGLQNLIQFLKSLYQIVNYSEWSSQNYKPINVLLAAIKKLDIDKVKDLDMMVEGSPFVTYYRDPRRAQREFGSYYISTGFDTLTMKIILQDIAKKLGREIIVDISY